MKATPIERDIIDRTIDEFQVADFGRATIREVKAIAAKAEAQSGVEFIKMEMGVPGLPPSAVGVEAEIEALRNGIASLYPDINGLDELKREASRFVKAFVDVDIAPEGCVPVTGSDVRLVPDVQPMRPAQGHHPLHRPRISRTEAAAGGDGAEI